MKRKEFKQDVRLLSSPEDFNENEKVLDSVNRWEFDIFKYCLKLGANISNAKEMTSIIFRITVETHLISEDVFKLLPKFKRIDRLLEMSK